jgi:hypothetical protein
MTALTAPRGIAEKTFRRLDAPELLADVANGVVYVNGVRACEPGRDEGRRLISFTHFLTGLKLVGATQKVSWGSCRSGAWCSISRQWRSFCGCAGIVSDAFLSRRATIEPLDRSERIDSCSESAALPLATHIVIAAGLGLPECGRIRWRVPEQRQFDGHAAAVLVDQG